MVIQIENWQSVIANDLAAGEGVEPSSSGSKPDVLPVAPSRKALPNFDF
jgi:hypothetical protein